MKKILSFIITLSSFSVLTAQSSAEVKFIKGNITDKISVVSQSGDSEKSLIAPKALEFVLENMNVVKNDRDLGALAVAAVLSYPEEIYTLNSSQTIIKFSHIFYGFTDINVKIAVFDKITALYKVKNDPAVVDFMNKYLYERLSKKLAFTDIDKTCIRNLSEIGNSYSFNLLLQACTLENWKDANQIVQDAVIKLTAASTTEIKNFIAKADFNQLDLVYSLFIKNTQISPLLKAEISENLLTKCMLLVKESSRISKENSLMQYACVQALYEADWTRSGNIVITYFEFAKKEYEASFISLEQFVNVINYVEKLASKNSSRIFIEYLETLNKETDNNNLPAEEIVLAVIKALGALGDKSAFDCLLYTTYLPYSESIISQARSAISSLKW